MYLQFLALEKEPLIAYGSAARKPVMPACGGIKRASSPATRACGQQAARGAGPQGRPALSCLILGKCTPRSQHGYTFLALFGNIFPPLFYPDVRGIPGLSTNIEEEVFLSELRMIRNQQDARAYRKIMLARYYHGKPLIFLTLTFKEVLEKKTDRNPYKLKLQRLMEFLREKWDVEYLAVETGEGNSVFHLALVCPYIHHTVIRNWWRENTGAWNIHISREKSLPAFLSEMTGQQNVRRYSMSRNFIPKGSLAYLESLKTYFMGKTLNLACRQFARRLQASGLEQARENTICCIQRGYGICSDIKTKQVIFNGR